MVEQLRDKDLKKSVGEIYEQIKLPKEVIEEMSSIGDNKFNEYMEKHFPTRCCFNCTSYKEGFCMEGNEKIKKDPDDFCSLFELKGKEEKYQKVREVYFLILKVLKKFLDIPEDYLKVISVWIIGTYFHYNFPSYPFLFFNAPKSSGKSRTIKLICYLSKNGKVVNHVSENVLFRMAKNRCFGIDEFENMTSKDKTLLKLLLNSAYKKGTTVERMTKTRKDNKEEFVVESFEVYCPIIMANIWGIEDVLNDRCISFVLDKSHDSSIINLMEIFDEDDEIKKLNELLINLVSVVSCRMLKNIYKEWNEYIRHTYTTYTTNTTNTTNITPENIPFFDQIIQNKIEGRNIELFFPLFILGNWIGQDVLNDIIKVATIIVKSKQEEDFTESRDISLLSFIANRIPDNNFISLKTITNEFRGEEGEEWQTYEWVGRALKRLNLLIEKRRVSKGREVRINFNKAIEKISKFKRNETNPKASK